MKEQWEIRWVDYYKVFNLPKTATIEEIKTAYRKMVVRYHPDNIKEASDKDKALAHNMIVLANEAFTVLGNAEKRAKYDKAYEMKAKENKALVPKKEEKKEKKEEPKKEEVKKIGVWGWIKKHKKPLIAIAIIAAICSYGKSKTGTDQPQPVVDPTPGIEQPVVEPTEEPIVDGDKEVTPIVRPIITIQNPTPNTTPTPVTTPTETPVEVTPAPAEPTPVVIKEVEKAADTVFANWQRLGIGYSRETVKDLILCLNGYESSMSIETADEVLRNIVEVAVTPGINNAFAGQKIYPTSQIDFSSLLVKDRSGFGAVKSMELDLNGALVDPENMKIYGERAFTDEALMLIHHQVVDGISETTGNPVARMLWARLAIGANGMFGSLGDNLVVTVNGVNYTQDDLNNAQVLENMVRTAKADLGSVAKTMN